MILPPLRIALAPAPLDHKLRTFAGVEAVAARHLFSLAAKAQDPELKSIIEKTIPFEQRHTTWYEQQGRRMLRPQDQQ